MDEKKMFGPHTLKDEYHLALKKGLEKLLIIDKTQKLIMAMAWNAPTAYVALAVLAHEYGHAALYEGIKIAMAFSDDEQKGN